MTTGFPLERKQRQRIQELYHAERDHRIAKRLLALLWVDQDYDQFQVAQLLFVEARTVRKWLNTYRNQGLEALCTLKYKGDKGELSTSQQQQLKEVIKTGHYRSAKQVCDWIQRTFALTYSHSGVTRLLQRLGCTYHKASGFLFKAKREKQEEWLQRFQADKKLVCPTLRRYFLDGVHPVWGKDTLYSCWLWCGQRLEAPLGSGRKRLNILGAYCPEDHEYLDRRYVKDNLNAQSVIALFALLMEKHPEVKVFVIYLDNAKYQHALVLQEWLATVKQSQQVEFRLEYLPGYSPNLNLIERLWKFLRKEALQQWHATFESMVAAVANVLDHLRNYRKEIKSLMTQRFHLVPARSALEVA
jgi:transposase